MTFDPFILKKLFSMMVHLIPGIPLLMLLALFLLNWSPKYSIRCLWLCTLTLLMFSSPLVSNVLIKSLEARVPPLQSAPADTRVILILGSGHQFKPGRAPNSVLTAVSSARVIEGVRLWRTNRMAIFITSGAQSYAETSTAKFAKLLAIEQGIPKSQVRQFDTAHDTEDEIRMAVELLRKQSDISHPRLVIVSSATHLPRAEKIALSHDITYSLAPTNFLAYDKPWYQLDAGTLHSADRSLHEYVGMLWLWIRS